MELRGPGVLGRARSGAGHVKREDGPEPVECLAAEPGAGGRTGSGVVVPLTQAGQDGGAGGPVGTATWPVVEEFRVGGVGLGEELGLGRVTLRCVVERGELEQGPGSGPVGRATDGHGLFRLPSGLEGAGEVVVGLARSGLDPYRIAELGDRRVLLFQHGVETGAGKDMVGCEPQRLAELGHRRVEIAAQSQGLGELDARVPTSPGLSRRREAVDGGRGRAGVGRDQRRVPGAGLDRGADVRVRGNRGGGPIPRQAGGREPGLEKSDVPHLDLRVVSADREPLPTRVEGQARDPSAPPRQPHEGPQAHRIGQDDLAIRATRSDQFPVRAQGHDQHPILVMPLDPRPGLEVDQRDGGQAPVDPTDDHACTAEIAYHRLAFAWDPGRSWARLHRQINDVEPTADRLEHQLAAVIGEIEGRDPGRSESIAERHPGQMARLVRSIVGKSVIERSPDLALDMHTGRDFVHENVPVRASGNDPAAGAIEGQC